jgi:glycosyltransferase involved in cell wall biosynthesis
MPLPAANMLDTPDFRNWALFHAEMNDSKQDQSVKVSVHMPTYNHERYVAQALDSALEQVTDFDFEIVIGEDCSTDGTRQIVLDYAARYPGKVRVLVHEKNLGIWENDQTIIAQCSGQYIAWLESDDFWTSPHKLQKQVDFLDANQDYSACFHWATCLSETTRPVTWRPGPPQLKPFYTLDDLLEHGHFAPSCTAVFRADLVRQPLGWTRHTPFLETTYFARFALAGKIGFFDEEMATFRYHGGGVYGKATNTENMRSAINAHRLLGKHFHVANRKAYGSGLSRMYRDLSREYGREAKPVRAFAAQCMAWLGK